MHTFRIRNGYGEKRRPLIEFVQVDETTLRNDLNAAFDQFEAELTSSTDLWQNDEVIFKYSGSGGDFEVSFSTWGTYFIQELGHSDIIVRLANALNEDPNFQQE